MKLKCLSFSVLLPIAEIAIWMVLVPIQTSIIYYRFHQAAQGKQVVRIHTEHFEWTVPRDKWFITALTSTASKHSETIMAVNLPGLLVEVLISLPTAWPSVWNPTELVFPAWRSLTFPIYCLPAWWFIGRGVDGLLGRRRLSRAMLLTGSTAFLLFLVFLFGFFFDASPSERADMSWILPGVGLWNVAFGLFPLTWARQRIADRKSSADDRNL